VAERIITKAARVSGLTGQRRLSEAERARLLHARRVVARHVRARGLDRENQDVDVIWKLFEDIGPRFANRHGGYLRITKVPQLRKGDNAPLSIVEFVEGPTASSDKKPSEGRAGRAGTRKGLLGGLLGGGGRKAKRPAQADEDEDEESEDEGETK
jgi:large subunit ribosomal protein L17